MTLTAVARRLPRSPAVHFALAGALLFALLRGGGPEEPARERLEVPASRLAEARESFLARHHRPPGPAEEALLVETVVDQEVLFRHALRLGLADQEPVERRLARIATFVATDPSRRRPAAELAREALDLGLHRDDMVVRRILIDSATRLIRAAVLDRELSEAALEDYLRRHPERFERPEEIRLAYVEEAGEGGVEGARELPALTRRDLARRFGYRFTEELDLSRVGRWQGPLGSRLGRVRVIVREHRPARAATLDEARAAVRAEAAEELADRWLAARLEQLRREYEIVLPGVGSAS